MRLGFSPAFIALLGIVFHTAMARSGNINDVPASTSEFAITAMTVDGTNLVLHAIIPAGLEHLILETRTTLEGAWEPAGQFEVPSGGGDVVLTIPKPSMPTAFFRLQAKQSLPNSPLISSELQYVAIPSLGSNLAMDGDAIFHFKGTVDGSDKILITRTGALWTHANWGWPQGPVTINDHAWKKNFLTTTGDVAFLPQKFSLVAVQLEPIQGRDVIALERVENGLVVYLDDTPVGGTTYEFNIRFHPLAAEPVKPASTVATLRIAAQIDGSDLIKLTAKEARWQHQAQAWANPREVTLNGISWSPQMTNVITNEGTNRFLPAGVDFSTANIVRRKGRDVATMWSDKDAMWIRFADNPNGTDAYELEISFGH